MTPHSLSRLAPFLLAAILLAAAPAYSATDVAELLQPGDPIDVAAAGLILPGRFAAVPDLDRPISLLEHSSQLTLSASGSRPFRQEGHTDERVEGSRDDALLHWRGKGGLALGIRFRAADLRAEENGRFGGVGHLARSAEGLGAAGQCGSMRFGLSLQGGRQSGDILTTRLSGMEVAPGLRLGRVTWRYRFDGAVLEAETRSAGLDAGVLLAGAKGPFHAESYTRGRGYFADLDATRASLSPYLSWERGRSRRTALLSYSHATAFGPITSGALAAGSGRGASKAFSAAVARDARSDAGTRFLYSLEVSGLESRFAGAAGGFLVPGVFTTRYAVRDTFSLYKLSARAGAERDCGSFRLRGSLLLAYGVADGLLYSSEANWMQSLRVTMNERLNRARFWAAAPALGAGYRWDDWSLDTGVALYAGGILHRKKTPAAAPSQPATPTEPNRVKPGWRWSLVLRRRL